MSAAAVGRDASLPRSVSGSRSPILWGVGLLIAIESTVMGLFITSYFYLRLATTQWPPPGIEPPQFWPAALGLALLLASPFPALVGLRALRRGQLLPLLLAVPAGMLLAAGYLAIQAVEYAGKDYRWTTNAYGSLDWSMGGYAALHVIVLLLLSGTVWLLALRGHFNEHRLAGVQAMAMYWVFVAAGSLAFFLTQYLSPYLR